MHLYSRIALISLILFLIGCKKKEPIIDENTDVFRNGLLIINEGLFQQNNASLSWLDFSTNEVNNSVYEQKNGRLLGDTANDILKYGSKIYVVVNVSSIIEVLDAKSGVSIQQIPMVNGNTPKQPRYLQAYKDKIFISCFDGYVDILDTTSLEIINRIRVGSNPDAMTQFDTKLYVSNTGGLNYPNVDSTVSIIDMEQLQEVNRITVGKNPGTIKTDDSGNLYVITAKGLNTFDTHLIRYNSGTYSKDTIYNINASKLEKMGNKMLVLESDFNTTALHLFNLSTKSFEIMNFLPASDFRTLYGIQYDPYRQYIYCYDAVEFTNLGYVSAYSTSGSLIIKKKIGLCPSKAVIYE